MLASPLLLVFPIAMAFAAANDLFTMLIPNRISLVLIAAFAVASIAIGLDWQMIGLHAGVAAIVLVAGIVLFGFNLLGGGDAKLMAAGALWMGPEHVVFFIAYLTIFGGILAVAVLMYRKWIPVKIAGMTPWSKRLHLDGTGIPYGIAIACAGLLLYPQTVWFQYLNQ